MELLLTYLERKRAMFLTLIENLSLEQINTIPQGFNNNIIWNYGHAVLSTPALCYVRSGVGTEMEMPLLLKYRIGTRPEGFVAQEEIDVLKKFAITSLEQIRADVRDHKFGNIVPYATATYALEMKTIEDILTCSLAHEALHYGYAMAQRRLVQ